MVEHSPARLPEEAGRGFYPRQEAASEYVCYKCQDSRPGLSFKDLFISLFYKGAGKDHVIENKLRCAYTLSFYLLGLTA